MQCIVCGLPLSFSFLIFLLPHTVFAQKKFLHYGHSGHTVAANSVITGVPASDQSTNYCATGALRPFNMMTSNITVTKEAAAIKP